MDIVKKAKKFAIEAHKDQKRKYTQEPYVNHPISVSKLVREARGTKEMIAAALLHDVVEDTSVTNEEIKRIFGVKVATLVEMVTDVSKPSDGTRKVRKNLDREHLKKASNKAKTIKLADLIHNSYSIGKHDKDFAIVYMREKQALLEVLRGGDIVLWNAAKDIVDRYYKDLDGA